MSHKIDHYNTDTHTDNDNNNDDDNDNDSDTDTDNSNDSDNNNDKDNGNNDEEQEGEEEKESCSILFSDNLYHKINHCNNDSDKIIILIGSSSNKATTQEQLE